MQKGWAGWGDNAPRVQSKGFWKEAYRLNRKAQVAQEFLEGQDRTRMFTSLMDWLDPKAPIEWLYDFLGVIHDCQNLNWLLLTKRAELFSTRLREALDYCWKRAKEQNLHIGKIPHYDFIADWQCRNKPPENVWFGVTVENQEMANKRIPELFRIPARIRWLSVEPLLEPIDFNAIPINDHVTVSSLEGYGVDTKNVCQSIPNVHTERIHWVVVGGESGKNRRDCGVLAIKNIVEQCQAANVPVFVKQDSAQKPGQQGRIPDSIWSLKEYP